METNELLETLKTEVAAKKMLIKALKKEQAQMNKKLFAETKVGQVCLKALKKVTEPISVLNGRVTMTLENPVAAAFLKLEPSILEFLQKTKELKDNAEENLVAANKLAGMVLKLERQSAVDKVYCNLSKGTLELLHTEIKRIRPLTTQQRNFPRLAQNTPEV